MAEIRAALYGAVTPAGVSAVIAKVIELARAGDMAATKELFDRLLGKPKQTMEVEGLLAVAKLYAKDAPAEDV